MIEVLSTLGRDAKSWLQEEGIEDQAQDLHYQADIRYFRQGYEFSMDINPDALSNGGLRDLEDRFGTAHERLYGFRLTAPVELVNLRAVGTGRVTKIGFPKFESEGPDPSAAIVDEHRVHIEGGFVASKIYDRNLLKAGNRITGPAVIVQKDSTTVVHPEHVGEVDEYLNILILPQSASV